MVIRILSFGPVIKVIEPAHFIDRLRERIERQRQLAQNFPGTDREAVIDSQTERMCVP